MLSFILHAKVVSLIALCWVSAALAADKPPPSLAARLAAYQHVGINYADTGNATLRLYTAKQQERNLADAEQRRKDSERMTALRTQMLAAVGEERTRLSEQFDRLLSGRQREAFRAQYTYYTLVSVGEDYLELKSTDGKDSITLLPLRLVSRVLLPEKDEPAKPEAARHDAGKPE